MADDYEPWDFSKLKINIDPIVKNNLEFNAGIKQSMSAAVSGGFQDIIEASRTVLDPDVVRNAMSVSEPLKALALTAENVFRLRASIEPYVHDFTRITRTVDSVFDGLRHQQIKAVQEVAENLKEMSTFNLATTINNATRAIDYSTNVPYKRDDLPVAEVPKEVVHENLEKEAAKEKKKTGVRVPYNVLGMDFVEYVYMPCMSVAYSIKNADSIDAGFMFMLVVLNVFSITPLFRVLKTGKNGSVPEPVDFDNDVVVGMNEES